MQVIQVNSAPTKICDPGNRKFVHVFNNSDTTIYLCYDTDSATAAATLTVANGIPVDPRASYLLDNGGVNNIYNMAVYAVHGAAGVQKEVRVQGV